MRSAQAHSEIDQRTTYAPSLRDEKHIAAQQNTGTHRIVRPFWVVTPEAAEESPEPQIRADQGPLVPRSHEEQAYSDLDRVNLGMRKPSHSTKLQALEPFKFPVLPVAKAVLYTLRVWEGVVSSIRGRTFKAILEDVNDPQRGRELGEFYMGEVSEEDRPLVEIGAIFYWCVAVEVLHSRLRDVSELRFRRLPGWTSQRIKAVKQEAERLERLFGRSERERDSTGTRS